MNMGNLMCAVCCMLHNIFEAMLLCQSLHIVVSVFCISVYILFDHHRALWEYTIYTGLFLSLLGQSRFYLSLLIHIYIHWQIHYLCVRVGSCRPPLCGVYTACT